MVSKLLLVRELGEVTTRHPEARVGVSVPSIDNDAGQPICELCQHGSLPGARLPQHDHRARRRDHRGKRQGSLTKPPGFPDHVIIIRTERLGDLRDQILGGGTFPAYPAHPRNLKAKHITCHSPILSAPTDKHLCRPCANPSAALRSS
ncbi:hypothetical protein EASAB2608_06522 [Streptomyces sp. EAS-AB2608]|nr:hypothetical protein EASAB2608_06522 [Streptomyces sp. EAS-AB2608]